MFLQRYFQKKNLLILLLIKRLPAQISICASAHKAEKFTLFFKSTKSFNNSLSKHFINPLPFIFQNIQED